MSKATKVRRVWGKLLQLQLTLQQQLQPQLQLQLQLQLQQQLQQQQQLQLNVKSWQIYERQKYDLKEIPPVLSYEASEEFQTLKNHDTELSFEAQLRTAAAAV